MLVALCDATGRSRGWRKKGIVFGSLHLPRCPRVYVVVERESCSASKTNACYLHNRFQDICGDSPHGAITKAVEERMSLMIVVVKVVA